MDPIDSWVDAAALRKLAESLVAPSLQAEEPQPETFGPAFVGFERSEPSPGAAQTGAPPEEPTPPPPEASPTRREDQARAALAGARQVADRGGILEHADSPVPQGSSQAVAVRPQAPAETRQTSVPAVRSATLAPKARPIPAPGGLLMDRLRAYGDWLHKSVGAKAFFIADREGELLIDEVHSQKLLQVARTLAQASWAASRQGGGEPAMGSLHVKLGAESVLEVLPVVTQYGPLILGLVVPGLLPVATVQVVASSLERAVNTPIQGA